MERSHVQRYHPSRPLPPYSYVPGRSPHPMSDERGHSFGQTEPAAAALDEKQYATNEAYCYAIDLFNHGYYWEAHEAWEAVWHACGRKGRAADFLKGLIKLAAAGVKAREGRRVGVRQHAERAAELFRGVSGNSAGEEELLYGLSLAGLVNSAYLLAAKADELAGDGHSDAARRLPVVMELAPIAKRQD